MDKRNTTRIEVPLAGGNGMAIGSGYPIAPDCILTCRHVVEPEGGRDLHEPIAVYVRYREHEGAIQVSQPPVLPQDPDLDVALLHLDERIDTWIRPSILLRRPPEDGEDFTAEGYPRVFEESRGSGRVESSFLGATHSTLPDSDTFEVQVSSEVEHWLGWKGMSGAAIIVRDRILGVVKWTRDGFKAKRIRATPVKRAFEDPQLAAALAELEQRWTDPFRDTLQRRMASLLESGKGLCSALAQDLGCQPTASAVARELSGLEAERMVAAVARVALADERCHKAAIELITCQLALCSDWDQLLADGELSTKGVLKLGIRNLAMAEVAMARRHQLRCVFDAARSQLCAVGGGLILTGLERGVDHDGSRLTADVVGVLKCELGLDLVSNDGLGGALAPAVAKKVLPGFGGDAGDAWFQSQVNARLKALRASKNADRGILPRYVVIASRKPADVQWLDQVAQGLKNALPELDVLRLDFIEEDPHAPLAMQIQLILQTLSPDQSHG